MSEFVVGVARREASSPWHAPVVVQPDARAGHRARLLRRRRPATGTLAGIAPGGSAVVVGVDGDLDAGAARRLVHLGFAPAARVEVLRRAPLGDPTIFRVADTEIALRRRHAAVIRVEPVSHP